MLIRSRDCCEILVWSKKKLKEWSIFNNKTLTTDIIPLVINTRDFILGAALAKSDPMSRCSRDLASIFFTFYISVYYRRILFIQKYKKSNRIPSEHNTVCLTFIKGDLVFVKKTFLSQINGSGWARGWFEFLLDSIKRSAVVNATDLSLLAPFHWSLTLAVTWGRLFVNQTPAL